MLFFAEAGERPFAEAAETIVLAIFSGDTSKGEHGQTVHQLLANYQNRAEGGAGYMRLIEFLPDGSLVVRSFSPSLNRIKTADDQQFTLRT